MRVMMMKFSMKPTMDRTWRKIRNQIQMLRMIKMPTNTVKVLGTKLMLMKAKKFPSIWFSQEIKTKAICKRRKTNKESGDMDEFNALMMTIA